MPAENYKTLIASLGGHKRYLSQLANSVETYLEPDELVGELFIEAEDHLKTLRARVVIVQDMFDELLLLPQVTEEDIDTFAVYMKSIKPKVAKLQFKIKKVVKPKPVSNADESVRSTCDSAIKYPELSLPTFSGGSNGIREFRPFYQIFKALVEDKPDIPGIYKVQYLRECLPEGSESRRLISHIPPLEENYGLIMQTLMSRYYNTAGEANRLRRTLMQIEHWMLVSQ